MATSKFELTVVQAIESAIALLKGETCEFETEQVINRLTHELNTRKIISERNKSNLRRKTDTAKANAELLQSVLDILPAVDYNEDGKPKGGYNLATITAKVPGITSASKLGVVMCPAINSGTVIKYRGRLNGKTVTFYALA